jgi:hypothetical protein
VHALDSDEFDVTGGRGTGDEGVRAGWVQPGERVGQVGGDLIGADHHQVEVGHQGERAATWAAARSACQSVSSATAPARFSRMVCVAWARLRRSWESATAAAAAAAGKGGMPR